MLGFDIGGAFLKMVEERRGKRVLGWLVDAIIVGIFVAVGAGILFVLNQIIDFLSRLNKIFSIDSTEVLAASPIVFSSSVVIVVFALIIVVASVLILRLARRTMVPQGAVDELAQIRADGINEVFAKKPIDDVDFGKWDTKYLDWEKRVKDHLRNHFPRADFLRFDNLGAVPLMPFDTRLIHNADHERRMRNMAKQLDIIEEFLATYRRQ